MKKFTKGKRQTTVDMKGPNQVYKIGQICCKNITTLLRSLKECLINYYITESYGFTPEVLEATYVDMEITLPIYVECPKFSKVKTIIQDENYITIGRHHYNTMLDTRVYDVEYLY